MPNVSMVVCVQLALQLLRRSSCGLGTPTTSAEQDEERLIRLDHFQLVGLLHHGRDALLSRVDLRCRRHERLLRLSLWRRGVCRMRKEGYDNAKKCERFYDWRNFKSGRTRL